MEEGEAWVVLWAREIIIIIKEVINTEIQTLCHLKPMFAIVVVNQGIGLMIVPKIMIRTMIRVEPWVCRDSNYIDKQW